MSRLRVVFSIGALHGGGSERQIVSMLRHLDRDRFEPHLYLIYRSGPLLPLLPDDVPTVAFEERDRRSMSKIPGGMHRRRVADLKRFFHEVRADISYDRTFLMTLVAADAAQQAGVPNVSTIVTDPSTGFSPVAGRFQSFKRRSLKRLYGRSAAVLAVSDGAGRSAESFYGLTPMSVQTLYNGVDQQAIANAANGRPDSSWWNAPSSAGKDVVRVVAAGRLNFEKGFHLLIDAVAALQQELPDREFRLALLGEGGRRQQLQEQADQHGLSDQVGLPGFRDDAAAWYRSADVYVLSSLMEGMPNVVLEAMACGTPVVATDCPHGPREILQDDCGILCDVNSARGLADGIRQVILDPEKTARRTARATERIEQVFSQTAAMDKLQKILIQAAKRDQEK